MRGEVRTSTPLQRLLLAHGTSGDCRVQDCLAIKAQAERSNAFFEQHVARVHEACCRGTYLAHARPCLHSDLLLHRINRYHLPPHGAAELGWRRPSPKAQASSTASHEGPT